MNAVQCDQCSTFAANPNGRSFGYDGIGRLPDGSVSLWAGNGADQGKEPQVRGEFCSTKCAGKYLIAYRPILVARAA